MAAHTHRDKQDLHRRLVDRLREQAADIERLASGLPEEMLAARTASGKWSLKELACHCRRVQEVFEGRIRAMLDEESPAVVPYDPSGDAEFDRLAGAGTTRQLLTEFLEERERLATRLEALSAAEWHRPGRHPEYQYYDVHFQVEYMVHHEAHHVYQMLERRARFGQLPH